METRNWPDFTRGLSAELRNLRGGAPEVIKAFGALAQNEVQGTDRDRNFSCDAL